MTAAAKSTTPSHTNLGGAGALEASGLDDALQKAENTSIAMTDLVIADPSNPIALLAFQQSLEDKKFLTEAASNQINKDGQAKDQVVQNMKA